MTEKPAARRRGVGQFEQWCVENKVTVEYEALSALYRDPRDLSVLSDPQLRMMARAKVEQAVYDRWQKVYEDCTKRAQDMSALVMRGEKASLMDVLKGVLPWPFGSR